MVLKATEVAYLRFAHHDVTLAIRATKSNFLWELKGLHDLNFVFNA